MNSKMFVIPIDGPKPPKIAKRDVDLKLINDLNNLYETKDDWDVVLVSAKREFKAHKVILKARSPVLFAMFNNNMKESLENRVQIKDIDPKVLEVMLLFIYTGNTKDLDKLGISLMAAADKYALDQLKTICGNYLASNMTLKNCIEILISCKYLNDMNLKIKSLKYIKNNIREVIESKDWKSLDRDLVNEVLLFTSNNHSIETKISLKVPKLSQLGRLSSEGKLVHGFRWEIKASLQTAMIGENPVKSLGVFLYCVNTSENDFSCNAKAEIKLMSQKTGVINLSRKFEKTFTKDLRNWGYTSLISWEELVNPEKGFIKEDSINLEISLIVDPPKGLDNEEDTEEETID